MDFSLGAIIFGSIFLLIRILWEIGVYKKYTALEEAKQKKAAKRD